jgi:hypothetical protein
VADEQPYQQADIETDVLEPQPAVPPRPEEDVADTIRSQEPATPQPES